MSTKKLSKKIGIGVLIIVPLAFILSYLFTSLKMKNSLAIFLIVLCCGLVCFAYVVVYTKIEEKKEVRKDDFNDPFSK